MLRSLFRRFCYTQNTIRYRVEWPRLRDAFEKIPRAGVLFDGGAGSGEFMRKALVGGYAEKGIALEFDEPTFQVMRGNLGRRPDATLIQGSLLEVPLPDHTADVVMSTQVLEHIEDHQKAASELIRVLKPGGHAIITVPHPPEPFPNDGHVREGYTEADLRALFEPLGMTLLHTDYFLTRGTVNRFMKADKLPVHGAFVPVALIDAETSLGPEDRRADLPFGILGLFKKA
ncbi:MULTISPECIES: class I SAM-dependent methyltransferase [unclassified Verrucomicrobium]|jgi:SAM-dependent methyltransferase|uniref:class I SAM-dependent methyltransferase n=1 Tax=unclassified Verrucomicrobium TaxID=2625155 RepID=UPI00056EC83C|nr:MULTISPECIES: class I SAM-dependent methyltransferase [unclassified Verrucomicrobium]